MKGALAAFSLLYTCAVGIITKMNNIEIISVDSSSISKYGFFCGLKNPKIEGYQRKLNWLKQRFPEGMKLGVLYSASEGAVGFIEYIPGKYTWRAVGASGYMVIHCIVIMSLKYRGKGYGALLLGKCLQDAKEENKCGVVVVTSQGTWIAGKELFLENGFELVDKAPPSFELLVKKFGDAPLPTFEGDWEERLSGYGSGLSIIYSEQCPYIAKSVTEITNASHELGIDPKIIEISNCEEAQNAPSAYGVFNLVYKGKLLAYQPISKRRFLNIMNRELK